MVISSKNQKAKIGWKPIAEKILQEKKNFRKKIENSVVFIQLPESSEM